MPLQPRFSGAPWARSCRARFSPTLPLPHPPGLDITLTNNNDWFEDVARPAFLRLALVAGAAANAAATPSSAIYTSPQSAPYLTLLTVPKPGDTLRWAREGGLACAGAGVCVCGGEGECYTSKRNRAGPRLSANGWCVCVWGGCMGAPGPHLEMEHGK